MPLHELQEAFQQGLRSEDAVKNPDFITSDPGTGFDRGYQIYRHAYRARLAEALGNDFPCLSLLLGDQHWETLVKAYIRAHPSQYRSLRWFAQSLPAFVKENAPFSQQPIIGELADFEWQLRMAFDAADCETASMASLTAVPPEEWPELRLPPVPGLLILSHVYNSVAVWQALKDNRPPPAPQPLPTPEHWVIWRQERITRFQSVPEDEASGLRIIQDGGNFAALCEALAYWHEEERIPQRAIALVQGWLTAGMIQAPLTG